MKLGPLFTNLTRRTWTTFLSFIPNFLTLKILQDYVLRVWKTNHDHRSQLAEHKMFCSRQLERARVEVTDYSIPGWLQFRSLVCERDADQPTGRWGQEMEDSIVSSKYLRHTLLRIFCWNKKNFEEILKILWVRSGQPPILRQSDRCIYFFSFPKSAPSMVNTLVHRVVATCEFLSFSDSCEGNIQVRGRNKGWTPAVHHPREADIEVNSCSNSNVDLFDSLGRQKLRVSWVGTQQKVRFIGMSVFQLSADKSLKCFFHTLQLLIHRLWRYQEQEITLWRKQLGIGVGREMDQKHSSKEILSQTCTLGFSCKN